MTPHGALRVRDYRRLLAVLVLSGLGGEMQAVAVGRELYQRTDSAAALGLPGLAHFLPVLLLSLPAGHAADRYSSKRVLLVALGLSVLASSGLVALSLVQGPIPLIYLCLALVGCARAAARRPDRRCCRSWCRRTCSAMPSPGTAAIGNWLPSPAQRWVGWSWPSPNGPPLLMRWPPAAPSPARG